MTTVSVSVFKATCLELLERVRRTGEPVLVTKRGDPLVQVVPPPPAPQREGWLGMARGSGEITGDVLAPAAEESAWDVLHMKA